MSGLTLFGYIDPSVMTYAIQAGAGIAIAAGAFVGLYFRKAKKKVSKKLNIDENKNKEVESDEIEVSEDKEEKTVCEGKDVKAEKPDKKKSEKK